MSRMGQRGGERNREEDELVSQHMCDARLAKHHDEHHVRVIITSSLSLSFSPEAVPSALLTSCRNAFKNPLFQFVFT